MDLKFVPFQADHLDAVLEIEKLSFPQPWSRGMFEREISLPISHFFVAVLADVPAGYGGYWLIEGEAHLINLAVHPRHRNCGVGRHILSYLMDRAASQKASKILLEVRESNFPAQRLYSAMGFKAVGLRPRYYHNEDAVLMERTVPSAHDRAGE